MNLVSRKEAKELGLKRYYTGKECKHGHVAQRRVHDGSCCECQRLNSIQYTKDNYEKERTRKNQWGRENNWKYDSSRVNHTPPWADIEAIKEIHRNCPPGHHVDHIFPILGVTPEGYKTCGLNIPINLQYLPASENISKLNRIQPQDINDIL